MKAGIFKYYLFPLIIIISFQVIDLPGHLSIETIYSVSVFSEESAGDEDTDERKELDKSLNRLNGKSFNSPLLVNHFTKYCSHSSLCIEEVISPPPRS